ncbi:MAG TPA: prenyltransferase [Spirochaetia bacterium]|nr:prenyltransferase [Spirochaetia bacterium]
MAINLGMWKRASTQLVRMDSKVEWDALDVVSKWLIATRSGVTTVTLYSCVIAGLLAVHQGPFPWLTFIIVTLGLFLAHGANNLLNDYTDFRRGIDSDNYFRTQYGVHPLVQGFWTRPVQIRWFVVSGVLALLAALYAIYITRFDPIIIGLVVYGSLMLLLYTYPLKYFALGELTIFLIWGPIMIGGVYFVLTRQWSWEVALAGVPFGLSTASINIGKHIDKSREDKVKRVGTLPVLIGETAARVLTFAAILLAYAVTLYLIVVPRFLTPVMLIVFFAAPRGWKALVRLSKPRPLSAPPGYPVWPRWFSTVCFVHNRRFGNLFVLGIALDAVLRVVLPSFWR